MLFSIISWRPSFLRARPQLLHPQSLIAHELLRERGNPLNPCPRTLEGVSLSITDGQWRFMTYMDFMCETRMRHWPKKTWKAIYWENHVAVTIGVALRQSHGTCLDFHIWKQWKHKKMKQDLQIDEETPNSKPKQIADEACVTYTIQK